MNYEEARAYLENYTWSKSRNGLVRMKELMNRLGDPHKGLRFVHVAGSNGKGSTCAMLASVLKVAGYRTGLYISPHIEDFRERIQLNGENIPEDRLTEITGRLRSAVESMEGHPSWFEMVTAVAFCYFLEEKCDIVVLETGMGGEFDCTNIIDAPEAAVLTNIGLEHREFLGDTLKEIAGTKSGIIKPGCIAVAYDNQPEVRAVIERKARECAVPLVFADPSEVRLTGRNLDGQKFEWKGGEYHLPLHGEHQLRNVSVVLETVRALRMQGWIIPDEAVRQGLADVHWPARFEILSRKPLFILDGGHNKQCAQAAAESIREYLPDDKVTLLIGIQEHKDYMGVLDTLLPVTEKCCCVTPPGGKGLPAAELAEIIIGRGVPAVSFESISEAVRCCMDEDNPVLAFGSLYTAGEIRTEYRRLQNQ